MNAKLKEKLGLVLNDIYDSEKTDSDRLKVLTEAKDLVDEYITNLEDSIVDQKWLSNGCEVVR